MSVGTKVSHHHSGLACALGELQTPSKGNIRKAEGPNKGVTDIYWLCKQILP